MVIYQNGLEEPFVANSAFGTACSHFNVATPVRRQPKQRTDPLEPEMTKKARRNAPRLSHRLIVSWKSWAFKDYALEREKLAGDAEARSFSLPPVDAADKLLRYEAHLDRQLYRAMDQLERLQRHRRGEKVPPPLNINFGRKS